MKNKNKEKNFETLKKTIIEAIDDKKGEEIVSIDLRKINSPVADMFIICHANSERQVEAIADNIEEKVFKSLREKPSAKEGFENKEWILLDYFDIVVHVFKSEKREFFSLEDLWSDGEIIKHSNN